MARDWPLGCHFKPTDQELIKHLALKSRNQQPHLTALVGEKKLYGADASPWQILGENDVHWDLFDESGRKPTKRVTYVFTRLSKKSPYKISRIAGDGTWEGQDKAQDVQDYTGEIIGSRKMFTYILNSGLPQEGGWIMHEYCLAGSLKDRIGSTDYAICKITIDDEKLTCVKNFGVSGRRLGKRSIPSLALQCSKPSKMPRNSSVEEETPTNADANLGMGIETTKTPNHWSSKERFSKSPQSIMSSELISKGGQISSVVDEFVEKCTQSVDLTGGTSDGSRMDDDLAKYTALDGISEKDNSLVLLEVASESSDRSCDQRQQEGGEILSDQYPSPGIVLVEEVHPQCYDLTDCTLQVMVSDYFISEGTRSVNLMAGTSGTNDGPALDDDMGQFAALLNGIWEEDEGSVQPEAASAESCLSYHYPNSKMISNEHVQTQFIDAADCGRQQIMPCGRSSGEDENVQPHGTVDVVATNADEATGQAECAKNEVEMPHEQISPDLLDTDDDMITYQAMVDSFFVDGVPSLAGWDD